MVKRSWVVVLLGLIAICCDNEDSYIGAAFKSNPDIAITFVDTFSIVTSTVLLDSLPTSGTSIAIIGSYEDNLFGKVTSTAYIQMYNESTWEVDDDAIYDSAVLLLPYTGYWYGDTTQDVTIEVKEVDEDFTGTSLPHYWLEEGNYSYLNTSTAMYNTSHLSYYEQSVLATETFRPRPTTTTDTIRARITDVKGAAWFEEAMRESNYFSSATEFQKYFKGIAIRSTDGSAIVGINPTTATIRIYYREHRSEIFENTFFDINYTTSYWQFNQFNGDRTNTTLESLNSSNSIISSSLTNNQAFVQSGTGIMAKIEFPFIRNILNLHESILINSATLVIEPVTGTFSDEYPLPETLALYQTNQSNKPLAPLYMDNSDDQQYASISYNDEFGKTSGYTFYITNYIQSVVDAAATQPRGTYALLLGTPVAELKNSVDRACLGGGDHENYRMRLEVYFTYKN